jgi:hypothetical protein
MTLGNILLIAFITLFLGGTLAIILLSDRLIKKDNKNNKR